jgi:hypothetical protein
LTREAGSIKGGMARKLRLEYPGAIYPCSIGEIIVGGYLRRRGRAKKGSGRNILTIRACKGKGRGEW